MMQKRPEKSSASVREGTYHHGNLREALLQAALKRLQDGTRPELSLRELARDTGVTVNAAYRHFADKDALLTAVAAEGFLRLAASQQAVATGAKASRARELALGRDYICFAREQPALFRLMFARRDLAPDDADLADAGAAAFRPILDYTADTLSLPRRDPRCMGSALSLWALVHGLSQLLLDRQIARLVGDPEDLLETALRALQLNRAAAAPSRPRKADGRHTR